MWKKGLFSILIWLAIAIVGVALYLTREVDPMKEFITWALSVWPILALLGVIGIAATTWVFKHDFDKKAQPISDGFGIQAKSYARRKEIGVAAQMVAKTIHDQLDFTQQLEATMEAEQSLVLTPHTWAIGLSGMTGYPKKPENAAWLLLVVAVNAIGKAIDTLDLVIDGKTIPANHWHGGIVTAFNVYFNVTEWQWKGKNQVELIAYVGEKMHRSGRITIDFNVEPFGSHRI